MSDHTDVIVAQATEIVALRAHNQELEANFNSAQSELGELKGGIDRLRGLVGMPSHHPINVLEEAAARLKQRQAKPKPIEEEAT